MSDPNETELQDDHEPAPEPVSGGDEIADFPSMMVIEKSYDSSDLETF